MGASVIRTTETQGARVIGPRPNVTGESHATKTTLDAARSMALFLSQPAAKVRGTVEAVAAVRTPCNAAITAFVTMERITLRHESRRTELTRHSAAHRLRCCCPRQEEAGYRLRPSPRLPAESPPPSDFDLAFSSPRLRGRGTACLRTQCVVAMECSTNVRHDAQVVRHAMSRLPERIGAEGRKRMSLRDENRHLDIKREVNYRMTSLIDRYWLHYGAKKRSASREASVLAGIRSELGRLFVREVDGDAVTRWYENLTAVRGLSPGTAVRHFNVMHHMMEKAPTIWSRDTGIDRNPADQVEVRRPDDQRDRYLSEDELRRLKRALDDKTCCKGTRKINKTFCRLRMIVLIALTTGMRAAEVFGLKWQDVMYHEGLLAVRSKLKGGKMRYVPMPPELAGGLRRFPVVIGEERIFPPRAGATSGRQRLEGSFEDLLIVLVQRENESVVWPKGRNSALRAGIFKAWGSFDPMWLFWDGVK